MPAPPPSRATHLILVEDDEFIRSLLAAYFEKEQFRVSLAGTGRELLALLDAAPADVVILDLGLPDEEGLVLMRQMRARSNIPVVVLTARQEREHRIGALELGAADFLTKPCDPEELVLRVRNLLRLSTGPGGRRRDQHLRFEGWTLDLEARSLTGSGGVAVHLSRAEFNLLAALVQAPNRALSRSQLLDAISQHEETPSERMIDVLVARLRRKIERDPRSPSCIATLVGVGYKFIAPVRQRAG